MQGDERDKSSRRTKRHFPITARVPAPTAGVADGQLGTKRRIDVDNLARASFERQIPCRKISDFPRKRGVSSRGKDRRREKKKKETTGRLTIPCIRERARPTDMYIRKRYYFANMFRPLLIEGYLSVSASLVACRLKTLASKSARSTSLEIS